VHAKLVVPIGSLVISGTIIVAGVLGLAVPRASTVEDLHPRGNNP
jgi:hypothetical protein